jgi:uncharacterized protein YkwD
MTRTRTGLARIALATMLAAGLTSLAATPANAAVTYRTKMYRATNHSRINHEVRRVDISDRVSKLARQHSIAMAAKGGVFHTSSTTVQNKYLDGIDWRLWGENVGVTTGTVAGLQAEFMASPLHRANILDTRFRRVAVGAYRDDAGLLWVTIVFWG